MLSLAHPHQFYPYFFSSCLVLAKTRQTKSRGKYEWGRFSPVTQSCPTLWPHGLQHARPPCPSPTPRACSSSCPSSRWCRPTISSSVVPFSYHLQSFPASGSLLMSQFFSSGGQGIGVSASSSVLPVNIQDWSPLGCTGWISLQSKGLSRVFSSPTVQKHWTVWKEWGQVTSNYSNHPLGWIIRTFPSKPATRASSDQCNSCAGL